MKHIIILLIGLGAIVLLWCSEHGSAVEKLAGRRWVATVGTWSGLSAFRLEPGAKKTRLSRLARVEVWGVSGGKGETEFFTRNNGAWGADAQIESFGVLPLQPSLGSPTGLVMTFTSVEENICRAQVAVGRLAHVAALAVTPGIGTLTEEVEFVAAPDVEQN